jgi:hypothetical protein
MEQNLKLNSFGLITFVTTLLLPLLCFGQGAAYHEVKDDFFTSTEPLAVEIKLNLDMLNKANQSKNAYKQAILTYKNAANEVAKLKIKVKCRTSSRDSLRCDFPLLTLNFPKEKVQGTLFAGLDKVQLVTPCQTNDSSALDRLLLEYACYKTYELLTAFSFRVRLVDVTLTDSASIIQSIHFKSFILEDEDQLAKRHNGKLLKIGNLQMSFMDKASMNRFSMFQYMIGNTQWALPTLYNLKLISLAGKSLIPIPFEFSQSGLINAQNAQVAPNLKITDVHSRQFIGVNMDTSELTEIQKLFNDNQQQIIHSIESLDLKNESIRKQAITFINEFFIELNSGQGFLVN